MSEGEGEVVESSVELANALRATVNDDLGIQLGEEPEGPTAEAPQEEEAVVPTEEVVAQPQVIDGKLHYKDYEFSPEELDAIIESLDRLQSEPDIDPEAYKRFQEFSPLLDRLQAALGRDDDLRRLIYQTVIEGQPLASVLQSFQPAQSPEYQGGAEYPGEDEYVTMAQMRQLLQEHAGALQQQILAQAQLPLFRRTVDAWRQELEKEYGVTLTEPEYEQVVRTTTNLGKFADWQNAQENPLREAFIAVKADAILNKQKALSAQRQTNTAPAEGRPISRSSAAKSQAEAKDPLLQLAEGLKELAAEY